MFCAGGNKSNEKTRPRPSPKVNHIRTYLPARIILETSHPALCPIEDLILTICPADLKPLFQAGRNWIGTVMGTVERVEMVGTEMLGTLGCLNQAGLVTTLVIGEVEILVLEILGELLTVVLDLNVNVLALTRHDGQPNLHARTWRGLLLQIA
jgi:hypothetical protein